MTDETSLEQPEPDGVSVQHQLVSAVQDLAVEVEGLNRKLSATKTLSRRTRYLTFGAIGLGAVCLILFVVTAISVIQANRAAEKAKDAAADSATALAAVEDQADQNTKIIGCLTTYAANLTKVLQERDAVSRTARAAQSELWGTFEMLVEEPETPHARRIFLNSVDRYQKILSRLDKTATINPYPDLEGCSVEDIITSSIQPVAFHQAGARAQCFGLAITISGSAQNEILIGTDQNDVIKGFRGDDLIYAGRGNDTICGGRGKDTINGGQQRDRARGQRGSDFCVLVEEARSC